MDEFAGKVALITGAGRGAGQELALAFASLGVLVAANDINPLNLDEVISQVQRAGGDARGYVFDVAKRMPIEGLVAQVVEDFGRIDILVNHASVQPEAYLMDMDEWEFHRTLDVNLGGPFFCMQQVGRIMRQHAGGVMVNILSGSGSTAHSAYLASQAGLAALTRAAAQELGAYNIRVNAACDAPGLAGLGALPAQELPAYREWCKQLPLLPAGEQSEMVSLVLFLCSPAAASVAGQVLFTHV